MWGGHFVGSPTSNYCLSDLLESGFTVTMTQRHEESDDDTYVVLGSAFEKLETVEDVEKAKRKKDKEHYVTDEQGRRRFHGAFTGGFSAGYYNTVGSKEGR